MRPTIPGSRPSHTTRSAFTLVELLAVLCVIAALLALLSTALARTQPNSKSFQCLNNLRQLGLAQTMYATENRDKLAYPNFNPPWIKDGWLYNGSAGSPPNLFAAPYVTNPTLAYAGGSLWPYLKNMGVYRCPLDKTNATSFAQRANKLSTYVMNGAVCGYGNGSPGRATSAATSRRINTSCGSRMRIFPARTTTGAVSPAFTTVA